MYKTQLKTTALGTTGVQITRVGFGAWALAGAMTRERVQRLPADDWRSRDRASPSRNCHGTSPWPRGCRRSPIATA